MITFDNAIQVGKAIVLARTLETSTINSFNTFDDNIKASRVQGVRGATYKALQNVWYDCLTIKVREQFGHSFDRYSKTCGLE